MRAYSLEEGKKLVESARYAMELFITTPHFDRVMIERGLDSFTQRHGVFVTIYHYPTRELRGCIGFTEGIKPMRSLIVDAAIAAATEDPRFVPISHREFPHVIIEVSVLTEPERMKGSPEEIVKQVRIGRDGLIIDYGYSKGLLLPVVAVEQEWGPERFLEGVCEKAGLPRHAWKQSGVELYRFSTQVFHEKEPSGAVEELKLDKP